MIRRRTIAPAARKPRAIQRTPAGEEELHARHRHQPLGALQSTLGNRAVSRLVTGNQGRQPIQRFSFTNTDWNSTTEIGRSDTGAGGVVFFKDGSDNPLVVKAAADPLRETQLATVFYNLLGKKKRVSAPPTRIASDLERVRIANQIQSKGQYDDERKSGDIEDFGYKAKNVWVMGMARGKAFGSKRVPGHFSQAPLGERTIMLLEDADYIQRLGYVTACDLFLGNGDRIDVGNLGNWMTDTDGAIALIDNFSSESYQTLNQRGQSSWESSFLPEFSPSGAERKAATLYDLIKGTLPPEVSQSLEKSFGMSAQARKEHFAKNFAKGMAEGRKAILAKLLPKIGKRSRTLKNTVIQGEGGQEAWALLKRRARMLSKVK